MSSKAILILCAQALLIQAVFSQCTSRAAVDASGITSPLGWAGLGLANPGYNGLGPWANDRLPWEGRGLACDGIYPSMFSAMDFTPTSGGSLPVTSGSPIAPIGISVMSENAYEGILAVAGELPFVGSTTVDGVLPTVGAGAINHDCGNGINTMTALSAFSSPASVAEIELAAPCRINPLPLAAPQLANAAFPAFGLSGPAYPAPVVAANAFAAPACAAPALFTPAVAAPALVAPGIAAPALAYNGLGLEAPWTTGYGCDGLAFRAPHESIEITPTSGGSLPVSSASAVPPTGLIVSSETVYEGPLVVAGELPFVGSVTVDGVLPTAGAGAINHACGNGVNAMVSELSAFAPGYGAAIAPGIGYSAGRVGGCGCAI